MVTGTMPCSFFPRFFSPVVCRSLLEVLLVELLERLVMVDWRLCGATALVGLDVMVTFCASADGFLPCEGSMPAPSSRSSAGADAPQPISERRTQYAHRVDADLFSSPVHRGFPGVADGGR